MAPYGLWEPTGAAGQAGDTGTALGVQGRLGTPPEGRAEWGHQGHPQMAGQVGAPGAALALGIRHAPGYKAGLRPGTSWEHKSRGVPDFGAHGLCAAGHQPCWGIAGAGADGSGE